MEFQFAKRSTPMTYSGTNGEYHEWEKINDIRTVFWVVKTGTDSSRFCLVIGLVQAVAATITSTPTEIIISIADMQAPPMANLRENGS